VDQPTPPSPAVPENVTSCSYAHALLMGKVGARDIDAGVEIEQDFPMIYTHREAVEITQSTNLPRPLWWVAVCCRYGTGVYEGGCFSFHYAGDRIYR